MLSAHVDIRVFNDLISAKLPKISTHMEKINVMLSMLCTSWFCCLYSQATPITTVVRIFDALFNEGNKILFRVGLAFLKGNEELILTCADGAECFTLIKKAVNRCFDCDQLLAIAFNGIGSLSKKQIKQLRLHHAPEVFKSLQELEIKRDSIRTQVKERSNPAFYNFFYFMILIIFLTKSRYNVLKFILYSKINVTVCDR